MTADRFGQLRRVPSKGSVLESWNPFIEPGDRILGMKLDQGGHLTHGMKLNFSGKLYEVHAYGVRQDTERIDYDALEAQALEVRPKLIVAGASAYPRIIDFERMAARRASRS